MRVLKAAVAALAVVVGISGLAGPARAEEPK